MKIKDIFQNNQKNYTNKTEEGIKRRIHGASKMLDDIRTRIEEERKEIEKDSEKTDLMDQCEGQSDGLINKFQALKQQLIAKRDQLEAELGM